MIDWTKPIRWADDKTPATVLMLAEDGGAWVMSTINTAAYLFDKNGKSPRFPVVENAPEPIVSWVIVWSDGIGTTSPFEGYSREVFKNKTGVRALFKLTYTPGNGATVEVVEERK